MVLGVVGAPMTGLCDGCYTARGEDSREAAEAAETQPRHDLEILSLGFFPAALCNCGKWGNAFTERNCDTQASKRKMLEAAHAEHVGEVMQENTTNERHLEFH